MMLGNSLINWKSKKQKTVSKSSLAAEYRAMSSIASKVTWLVRLLQELNVAISKPMILFCDKKSTTFIAKNPVFHEILKDIDIDCHFTREKVLEELLQLSYLLTTKQRKDLFTKILSSIHFKNLMSKLGFRNP